MATLDQTKVNVAVNSNSKLDLSSTHITSQNFMRLQPVYYRHMLPHEHLRGSGKALTRLAPVVVPTYGRCRMNLRSFFVPFRTIFPNWNEFITDTIGSNVSNNSLIAGSPYFDNSDLYNLFKDGITDSGPLLSVLDPTDPDDAAAIAAGAYDVKIGADYYVLSPEGRHFMKILNSLGYRVIWDSKSDMPISALALLAYAKVYSDWYANQAYLDSVEYLQIQRLFKFNDPTSALHLNYIDIANILGFCSIVCYDTGNDVFTNAWDNPVAPNSGLFSGFTGMDITADTPGTSPFVSYNANGTPLMTQYSASATSIGTQYLHDFLKAATDYVKRNQLSGAAQIDRFLARFGVNLDSAKSNRSIYVSSQSIDVEFGTVMQTANTSSSDVSNLGDYAGQGIGRGQFGFDFQTDEYGIFIVTSSIVPAGSLYQGFDRNNFHVEKLSFYTPEFDNLGCSAISKAEVYVSNDSTFASAIQMQGVFGYAPRYYEYKQKLDYVTGDLVSPAAMSGGDSWHLNRIFDDSSFGTITGLVHSLDFTRGSDAGQYDRIFNYTDSDLDKFYVVYHFDVMGLAPCKSLFDTYDFDSAGDKLSINGNSAKVN